MSTDKDWGMIARYLAGECGPAEAAEIRAWAEADSSLARLLESGRQMWDTAGEALDVRELDRWDANTAWAAFARQLDASPVTGGSAGDATVDAVGRSDEIDERAGEDGWAAHIAGAVSRARVRRPYRPRPWLSSLGVLRSAAAVVLLIGAAALAPWLIERIRGPEPTRIFVTAKGEQSIVRLRDGSRVRLNVDSRLAIPGEFADATRTVTLEGEAYFEVTPDPVRPFIVRSDGATVSVLGTRFTVNAYPDDDAVEVVVTEGKVSMDPDGALTVDNAGTPSDEGAILTRGQLGRLRAGESLVEVESVRPEEHMDWTRRKLSFRDLPLDKVARRLERWYGVDFAVGDSTLGRERLTASFDFDEDSLGDVLTMISLSLRATYHADGRSVTFVPRPE